MFQPKNTSWQNVSKGYIDSVGTSGHYFHQHVVLPNAIRLLNLKSDSTLLDLACGQGVLARTINPSVEYYGLDLAPSLIKFANNSDKNPRHHFKVADVQKLLPLEKKDFTHATILLALQNIENPKEAIRTASKHLVEYGLLLIVINHPMFRIPRQTSWEIDPANKIQYRRVNRYLSPLKIPINANPGKGEQGELTWSFHHSLQDYVSFLKENRFKIVDLEEWISDKVSRGPAAKMENQSRTEFPLFMALLAEKQNT